jgi:thioredoxin-like negative regulator of GroEL
MVSYWAALVVCVVFVAWSREVKSLVEAPDGSVCFNNCNGHGECIDYSCHCHTGYLGDDCGTTFASSDVIVPILTAGHFNVTRKNITQTLGKHKHILVGFSSYSCHKCIQVEPEYAKIADALKTRKIPFARGNADTMKSIVTEFGAQSLPSLVYFHKLKPTLYKGVHSLEAVTQYIDKQTGPPILKLKSVEEVYDFMYSRSQPKYALSTIMAVGFFSQHEDIEEDDYEDFLEVAKDLQSNEDIYFGVVTNKSVIKYFKANKTIDRTPSMIIYGEDNQLHGINMDELYGERSSMKEWLLKKAVPLVGKMTPLNFVLYEKLNMPMLMMFLDLSEEMQSSTPGRIVGGRSGGILNEALLDELRAAAKEHVDRILFVYLDGNLYEDQMRSLGLYGGKERLPSLAFNTRDRTQAPFPEELAINKDTILQFCADFISGKIKSVDDSKEMAKKALQRATPLDTRNKAQRKEVRKSPQVVQGVSEQWGDGITGDKAAVAVTEQNFHEIVMNEDTDVVLLLHAKNCETCSHFNVYFKRMAQRFKDLAIPSLVIAQMDVTNVSPPAEYNMMVGALPLLLMVPATAKQAPWTYFSGVGKVQAMMKWIQQHVSIPFTLPNLPHLTEEQRVAYKQQVREREEYLEKKRLDEKKAMEDEEREQQELARRKRRQKKEAEVNNALFDDTVADNQQQADSITQQSDQKLHYHNDRRIEIPSADDDDKILPNHDEF